MNSYPRRLLLLAAILTGLILLLAGVAPAPPSGILDRARSLMEGLGWEGVAVYVAAFVAGSMIFVPATALSAIAPLLFGPWLGFVAIVAGNMAAAAAMFGVARWAGNRYGWFSGFQNRLPDGVSRLAHGNGMLLIFYARLLLMPASPVSYAAGLSPVSFKEMFLGTFLGAWPHCLSTALSIGIVRDAWLADRWSAMIRWETGLMLMTYGSTLWFVHRLRNRMRASARAGAAVRTEEGRADA